MISKPYIKQPWEQETVRIDWARRIASMPVGGYSINAVACAIFDSSGADVSADMLEGSPQHNGNYIYATIKGGEHNNNYAMRIRVTLIKDLADTQYQEDDLGIVVKQKGKG